MTYEFSVVVAQMIISLGAFIGMAVVIFIYAYMLARARAKIRDLQQKLIDYELDAEWIQ